MSASSSPSVRSSVFDNSVVCEKIAQQDATHSSATLLQPQAVGKYPPWVAASPAAVTKATTPAAYALASARRISTARRIGGFTGSEAGTGGPLDAALIGLRVFGAACRSR